MSWDLIRVIAVLGIITGHITYRGVMNHPELAGYPFMFAAQFGAATLLAVSGYFVCVTIRKGHRTNWYRSRLARVLPAYLAAVLVTYVITRFAVLAFHDWHTPPGLFGILFGAPTEPGPTDPSAPKPWYLPDADDLLANLTLLFGWSPDLRMVDGSYWTMPAQMLAFTVAAILWPTRWGTGRGIKKVLWAAMLLPFAARLLALLPEHFGDALTTGYAGTGLWRAYLFGAGVAIYLWSRDRLSDAQMVSLAWLAVLAHALDSEKKLVSAVGYAVMLGLLAAAAKGPDWDNVAVRILRRPITWVAGISYGVYLMHQQLGYILARVLVDHGVPGWVRMVLVVAAAVLAGWLLTVLVERPAHRFLTRDRSRDELEKVTPSTATTVSVGGAS
ncbi:MAG: acyltransferase family protein [Haloechinothrix sp.]